MPFDDTRSYCAFLLNFRVLFILFDFTAPPIFNLAKTEGDSEYLVCSLCFLIFFESPAVAITGLFAFSIFLMEASKRGFAR